MLEDLKLELKALEADGRLRDITPRTSKIGSEISYRNQKLIDFTSWDLLNLSNSPTLKRALQNEAEVSGVSPCASRISSGTLPAHLSLELRIAKFLGTDAAAIFSSTNQAMLSLSTALLCERDCVLVDNSDHHAIIDAAHLVGAELLRFSAESPEGLASLLDQSSGYRRRILFIEGLSPLTGAIPDLDQIMSICEKRNTFVVIDESFSLGAVGLRGAGSVEASKLQKKPFAVVAGMGNALCGYGAFISGSKVLINYLENRSRTFTSENAIPAPICAVAERAIDVIELAISAREKLCELSSRLRLGVISAGLTLGESGARSSSSPIVSIRMERPKIARKMISALIQRNILCELLNETALLDEAALIRFIVTASHSDKNIDHVLEALTELRKRVD